MAETQKGDQSLPDFQRQFGITNQNYMQTLQYASSPEDVRKRLREAYRNYLAEVKEAFINMDVNSIDVNTLQVIGQSLLTAANMSAAYGIDNIPR